MSVVRFRPWPPLISYCMSTHRRLLRNRQYFELLEAKAIKSQKLDDIMMALYFAAQNPTSRFYSDPLEQALANLARAYYKPSAEDMDVSYRSNSILHVMTTCFTHGGHTRVVERWIDSAPHDQQHSVVLTDQYNEMMIPQRLRDVVAGKRGELFVFDPDESFFEKAKTLYLISRRYQTIVLHQPEDPVPLMACSITGFNRPVILFNHAGVLFLLGRNCVDYSMDLNNEQLAITRQKLGISASEIVPMPADKVRDSIAVSSLEVRQSLGLPKDKQIIFSMASGYKYNHIPGYDFAQFIDTLLADNSQRFFLLVGVNPSSSRWRSLKKKYPDQFMALSTILYEQAYTYLKASDLYIDSFPVNSFLALQDAAAVGDLPVLSLKTPIGVLPFIRDTPFYCDTIEDLVKKTEWLLNNPDARKEACALLSERLRACDGDQFQASVQKIVRRINGSDAQKKLSIPSQFPLSSWRKLALPEITDVDLFLCSVAPYAMRRFGIPGFVEFLLIGDGNKRLHLYLKVFKTFIKISWARLLAKRFLT